MWQLDAFQPGLMQPESPAKSLVSAKRRGLLRLDGQFSGERTTPWRYENGAVRVRVRLTGAAKAELYTRVGGKRTVIPMSSTSSQLIRAKAFAAYRLVVTGDGAGFVEMVRA